MDYKNFKGFTSCIVGNGVSSAFLGIDPPPNIGNKKISDTVEASEKVTKRSKTILKDATSKSDLKNMENELAAKEEEISRLKEEISRMKASTTKKDEEISRMKEENARLKSSLEQLEEMEQTETESSMKLREKDEEITRMKAATATKLKEKDDEISRLKEKNAARRDKSKMLESKVARYEGYLSSQKEKTQELTIVDLNGVLPKLLENVTNWVRELIFRCLSVESENRPSFADIYEIMKENNFDLFSDSKNKKLTQKQVRMKEMIEKRVTKIEAFEFQHQDE